MKLGLGAVQFGLPYGVQKNPKVSLAEVKNILALAKQNDVSLIDTSCAYGDSEKALGLAIETTGDFSIVSKTPSFNLAKLTDQHGGQVYNTCMASLRRLNRQKLYGLLVHAADDLLVPGGEYIYEALQSLKAQGKVEKIGVSVYSPVQLEKIEKKYAIDLVQLPINIFDQRFLQTGYLVDLAKRNIEVHARSVFLQGVLLHPLERLPTYFAEHKIWFKQYHQQLANLNTTPVNAALGFASSLPGITVALLGVHSSTQLQQNINVFSNEKQFNYQALQAMACDNQDLIDPRRWQS
ncbi:MAG: aldo/keto reductase [Gammaproteobacteria bacterium]|nr:aldo/keto reductase [Gammaproteobacteria bacterium]